MYSAFAVANTANQSYLVATPAFAALPGAPVPDEVLGERACIYVELQPDASLSLDEICGWLEDNDVAKMKWPEKLEIVERMPLTPTRKIIKGALSAA